MFSQADYALAARILGLPEPRTPDEQAAAAPMTARVLRDVMQMRLSRLRRPRQRVCKPRLRLIHSWPLKKVCLAHQASRLGTSCSGDRTG